MVARALAATRPEAAAIIHGAARGIVVRNLKTPVATESKPTPPTTGGYFGELRRETTGLLASALGEQRLRQLRAEGDAMDDEHAIDYTLAQIADVLPDPTDKR